MTKAENATFVAEMNELYKGERCEICGKRPLCFKSCCWPPRGWWETFNKVCHACRVKYSTDREYLGICRTCGRPMMHHG